MRTIAIISQKGGAGKTTLALHIAVAAELAGYSTVVLDMDPQGTAEAWSEWRQEAPPIVVPAKTATLAKTLEKTASHGADFVIMDTPPLAEAEARAAAKTSDLVLVPCRPNAFDVHSIKTTSDLTRFAAKPAFAVFNSGPVNAVMQRAVARRRKRPRRRGRLPRKSAHCGYGYASRLACRHASVRTRGQRWRHERAAVRTEGVSKGRS